jgi:hypothetical protein
LSHGIAPTLIVILSDIVTADGDDQAMMRRDEERVKQID